MKAGYKSDKGIVRANNEDRIYVDEDIGLYILADGMGGAQGGEIASKMAIEEISSYIRNGLRTDNDISSIIDKAILKANQKIHTEASQNIHLAGMGTTVVLTLCLKDKYYFAHAGDSRAYLIRNSRIRQVTQDHSLVAELLKAGDINKDEARSHHMRHMITNAVGAKETVNVDIISMPAEQGDHILLCSDGLSDMITDDEIKEVVLKNNDMEVTCEELVSAANDKGGKDNISVVLIINS